MPPDINCRRDTQISKALAYLLRHGALKEQLHMDNDGFVALSELLNHNRLKSHKTTIDDVHRIIDTNEKKRFHLKQDQDGHEFVCAVQGHSIKSIEPSKELLEPITQIESLPSKLIHGTNIEKLILILESGYIKRMGRNHVHFSLGIVGVDKGVLSGMRKSSNVFVYLSLGTELLETVKLYKSLNDVYLAADDIPVSLIEKVVLKTQHSKPSSLEIAQKYMNEKDVPYELC